MPPYLLSLPSHPHRLILQLVRFLLLFFVYYSDLKLSALPSVNERFALHRTTSQRIKSAAKELGLKQLPLQDAEAANGMTALYFPEGVSAADLLPRLGAKDVVVAGGLLGGIKGTLLPPFLSAVG